MDVSQWQFYLLPKAMLDARLPMQKHLSLSALLRLEPVECSFEALGAAIQLIAEGLTKPDAAAEPARRANLANSPTA
jgi:hypothetical protein